MKHLINPIACLAAIILAPFFVLLILIVIILLIVIRNMKTIKMTIKGIMLYLTTLITMIFLCGVDSIVEQYDIAGLFAGFIICGTLVALCYGNISYDELKTLTLYNYFNDSDEELS